jgi:SAM-dependent methyltransferase
MSWDEEFANHYEEWSAEMTADVAFYVELAREADGPLVELAVGNGRVAIPVAQATGQRVLGIDFSPAMLEQARARAAEAGVELELREGDMRDLSLDELAALIYCPFRALLHLPTWADRRRTFERVAASLRPGGRFAWNAFAFDHGIAARLDGQHQQDPVPHTIGYAVGDNRIRHHTRRRRHQLPLVGNEERVARAPRRRRSRAGGALLRLRRRAVHRGQPGIRLRRALRRRRDVLGGLGGLLLDRLSFFVLRHRFVRPLTRERTLASLSRLRTYTVGSSFPRNWKIPQWRFASTWS